MIRQYTGMTVGSLELLISYASTDHKTRLFIWKASNPGVGHPLESCPVEVELSIQDASLIIFVLSYEDIEDYSALLDRALSLLHTLPEEMNPILEKAKL